MTQDIVSQVTEEERTARIEEHRAKIVSGEISLGPITPQDDVIVDNRDMRDPQELGEEILAEAAIARNPRTEDDVALSPQGYPLSEVVRGRDFSYVENYDPGETSAALTMRACITELTQRSASGDIYAKSMLDHYARTGSFQGAPAEPVDE